jgi:hypothetical protein
VRSSAVALGVWVALCAPQLARAETAFRLVTEASDPELWKKVEKELAPELVLQKHDGSRKVEWVGVADGAVLATVAIYSGEDTIDSFSEVFSLPLASDSHTRIELKVGGSQLHFERELPEVSALPTTLLFSVYSCSECESTKYLVAFRADPKTRRWSPLSWQTPESQPGLELDAMADEGWMAAECSIGLVANARGEQTDLGISCHERESETDPGQWVTERYARRGDSFVKSEVTGDAQVRALRAELCSHPLSTGQCASSP